MPQNYVWAELEDKVKWNASDTLWLARDFEKRGEDEAQATQISRARARRMRRLSAPPSEFLLGWGPALFQVSCSLLQSPEEPTSSSPTAEQSTRNLQTDQEVLLSPVVGGGTSPGRGGASPGRSPGRGSASPRTKAHKRKRSGAVGGGPDTSPVVDRHSEKSSVTGTDDSSSSLSDSVSEETASSSTSNETESSTPNHTRPPPSMPHFVRGLKLGDRMVLINRGKHLCRIESVGNAGKNEILIQLEADGKRQRVGWNHAKALLHPVHPRPGAAGTLPPRTVPGQPTPAALARQQPRKAPFPAPASSPGDAPGAKRSRGLPGPNPQARPGALQGRQFSHGDGDGQQPRTAGRGVPGRTPAQSAFTLKSYGTGPVVRVPVQALPPMQRVIIPFEPKPLPRAGQVATRSCIRRGVPPVRQRVSWGKIFEHTDPQ
eukprot:Hpha_TRINITY_DN6300_c0_g1::TRINITY_DN6300_c0_g1_i2::g.145489::m.145489